MSIKIYVACLSSYNCGFLHGKWLDLDNYSDSEEVLAAIHDEILQAPNNPAKSKYNELCEEWAIHDFEAPEACRICEYDSIERLMEMNELLNDKDGEQILAVKSDMGFDSIDEARRFHEDNYVGEFSNLSDLGYHFAEEVNGWDLSEGMGRYFDAEAYGRDLSYDLTEVNGHYYFNN